MRHSISLQLLDTKPLQHVLFLYSLFVSSGQYTHRPQILSPLLKECPNLAMARGRSSFVNVYLYIRQIIYIQRTKSIPFSEILCMIFATCISGVQNDRQRILMFCNVLGLSSKFIFLILLLNTIRNGLCSKIFLFSSIWTSVSSTKKKRK